ncbi:MAG: hypothetical protein KGI26_02345 [Thaumarchaeota archaeon]|nr:hypothetical protein [Nitrososphaerota archaeon]
MKRSQMLAVSVLALLLVSAVPLRAAYAQAGYTEKLNVYVAGSDALWYFTFGGVNGSAHLNALESTPGLSWYNVTAISTSGWQSDFQVFGPRGYGLLPVPYITPQGIFLTVGSDSYADASAAAAALDSYLLTSFSSYSNGTGTFIFFSPVSFSSLVPATLLKNFLPTTEHGFAAAISSSSFTSTPSPFVVLEGVKGSAGFDHSLMVGSIAYSALSSGGVPTVLGYFGQSVSSLRASNASTSSVVQITTLDGIMQSHDSATVTSRTSPFSGSYTLDVAAGHKVSGFNATVVEQPGVLLATRAVDVGVLRTGGNLSVTLAFTNLSPSYLISNVTYSDNWWSGAAGFSFLSGVDNVSSTALASGQGTTPVYRVHYSGTATGSFTIPASVVRYAYVAGGKSFNGSTILNPIRLSLNQDDAVVYASVRPVGSLNQPAGAAQNLNITVVNVGTLPASSISVAGKTIAGLSAKTGGSPGGAATVTVPVSAAGLTGVNVTKSFDVTYQNPSGASLQATTNLASVIFTHVGMVTAFPALTVGATIKPLPAGVTNLTLSFTSSDFGLMNMTSFEASGALPAGLGCGRIFGTGLTCAGGRVMLSYPLVNKSSSMRSSMTFNVTSLANYIVGPFTFSATTAGQNVTGASNLVAAPLGLRLTKAYTPAQLFGGMGSTVAAMAYNAGPLAFYNATVTASVDSFDSLTASVPLTKTGLTIGPGANATISYPVSMSQTYGNFSGTAVSASYYFGGTQFSTQGAKPSVLLFRPLTVSVVSSPATPEEGKSFTIAFEINNPSGVAVSNVLFTLPIPGGVTLSGLQNAQFSSGTLTVTAASLGPDSNATASATAVASSGVTIPFSGSKLTFSYTGVTVNGVVPKASGIAINENVTLRYVIPIAVVLLVMLGVAFYLRRMASSGPASR